MDLPWKAEATIGHFAKNLELWHDEGWLFVPNDTELTLETSCYQQGWNPRELSPEEQDKLDDRIRSAGYRSFFEWGQLDMIVENLRVQKSNFSDQELINAIKHYWANDAYIDLSRAQ